MKIDFICRERPQCPSSSSPSCSSPPAPPPTTGSARLESKSETELAEQRSFVLEARRSLERVGPEAAPLVARLASIEERINRGEDPEGVSRDCGALIDDVARAGGLVRSPRHVPDLQQGAELFAKNCAVCHGGDGRGDTPIAATLNPKPANFTSAELMDGLTPYKAFNVVTLGVQGTGMPPFATLTEEERWAVSFFVFTLRQPACASADAPAVKLEELANRSDAELSATHGAASLSCLRRPVLKVDESASLRSARAAVDKAVELAAAGNDDEAAHLVLDAYLTHIEPVEARLKARDANRVARIEQGFLDVRLAIQQHDGVKEKAAGLSALLEDAEHLGTTTTASVFWLALFIILREGFEAMVVVIALLAVLKSKQQTQHARIVHAGWASALVAGGVAFVFGQHLLAAADREWMEGITALIAVVMLLYAALWLSARSNMRVYMGELREKVSGALGTGNLAGFFFIAFMAAGRESFETALFLQGLAIDSPTGALWGAVAGLVGLAVLVVAMTRAGYRLPMQLLFKVSTWLLFATAVVLAGKGVHALQEVGLFAPHPAPFLRVDLLGLYPDALSLGAQLLVLLVPLALALRSKKTAATSSTT